MAVGGRRDFVKLLVGGGGVAPLARAMGSGAGASAGGAKPLAHPDEARAAPAKGRMPVLFVGHGSPMNAIEDNVWSRAIRALATRLPTPRAILSISAHWWVRGTFTTGDTHPETIHDFGGFPQALYDVRYPAPSDPALAQQVVRLVGEGRASVAASVANDWGLDHGTWSVLVHLRPAADVPVVQLSVDAGLPPQKLFDLGRSLAPLRDEGVLIMGSGNVTHNLRHAFSAARSGDRETPAWAHAFDEDVARALTQHDTRYLVGALETEAGRMAHPTPDHFLPLLYVAGAADAGDPLQMPITGFDMASLSMRAVLFG